MTFNCNAYKKEWLAADRAANPEKYRARDRDYYARNLEKSRGNANMKAKKRYARRLAEDPVTLHAERRWQHIKQTYGITMDQYDRLLKAQNGRCGICRRLPEEVHAKRMLGVDHCHETGEVRGLLCSPCNGAIGQLGDTTARVQRAVRYLEG